MRQKKGRDKTREEEKKIIQRTNDIENRASKRHKKINNLRQKSGGRRRLKTKSFGEKKE